MSEALLICCGLCRYVVVTVEMCLRSDLGI